MATPADDEENINSSSLLLNNGNDGKRGSSGKSSSGDVMEIPCCGCLSVQFYQPYFDVNSEDVKKRIYKAVIFCTNDELFTTLIEEKPDAYGPVWIATTLVFVIAVTSHMNSWFSSWIIGKTWSYNFQNVVSAASLIYSYSACAPIAIWLLFRQLEVPIKLITAICLYGYSLMVFVPAAMLCLIPSEAVSWLSLLGATVASSLFLLRNLGPIIVSSARQQAALLLTLIGLIQISLFFSIKLMFFK